MEMTVSQSESVTIADPRGRIDTAGAGAFGDRLAELVHSGTRDILIDLHQVRYISSIGFRALLVTARLIEQHKGRLVLCGISADIMRVFDMGGFTALFTICLTRDDGLRAMR